MRAEGILTQLIFSHALRIRVKATSNSKPADTKTVPQTTEDSQSTENGDGESSEGEGSQSTTSETVVASNASTKSSKKGKDIASPPPTQETPKKEKEEKKDKKADNLTGKLNNLVTSDLQNVINSRDFLMVGEWDFILSCSIIVNTKNSNSIICTCFYPSLYDFPLQDSRLEVGLYLLIYLKYRG